MSPYAITNPLPQNFSCNSCGKCCRKPWKVKLALDKVPAIEASATFQRIQARGFKPLRILNNEIQVGRKSDHSCHFLQDDLCSIHGELGPEQKPTVCQLYPFTLINTPDGYFLSLSFSCPTVLKNSGESLKSQVPHLQKIIEDSTFFPARVLGQNMAVALCQNREITWEQYLELETELLNHYSAQAPIKSLLQMVCKLVEAAADREFHWPNEVNKDILMEAASRFYIFCASAIATLEEPVSEAARERYTLRLLEPESIESNLLNAKIQGFQVHPPEESELQDLLKRYVENLILGKQLIHQAPLASRILMLAVSIGVLLYFLEQRKILAKRSKATDEDLEWVFDLVETSLMSHSDKMTDLFLQYEQILLWAAAGETQTD